MLIINKIASLAYILAFTALPALVSGDPDKSPLCTTAGALTAMNSDEMPLAGAFPSTLTADKASVAKGGNVVLTLSAPDKFHGILLYASINNSPASRVGSFNLPTGFQNNQRVCTTAGFTLESPNSVLTHTVGQTYEKSQTFTYTASTVGSISFHMIIVRSEGAKFLYSALDGLAPIIVTSGESAAYKSELPSTSTESKSSSSSITAKKSDTPVYGYDIFNQVDGAATVVRPTTSAPASRVSPPSYRAYEPSQQIVNPVASPSPSKCACSVPTVTIIRKCRRRASSTVIVEPAVETPTPSGYSVPSPTIIVEPVVETPTPSGYSVPSPTIIVDPVVETPTPTGYSVESPTFIVDPVVETPKKCKPKPTDGYLLPTIIVEPVVETPTPTGYSVESPTFIVEPVVVSPTPTGYAVVQSPAPKNGYAIKDVYI